MDHLPEVLLDPMVFRFKKTQFPFQDFVNSV